MSRLFHCTVLFGLGAHLISSFYLQLIKPFEFEFVVNDSAVGNIGMKPSRYASIGAFRYWINSIIANISAANWFSTEFLNKCENYDVLAKLFNFID